MPASEGWSEAAAWLFVSGIQPCNDGGKCLAWASAYTLPSTYRARTNSWQDFRYSKGYQGTCIAKPPRMSAHTVCLLARHVCAGPLKSLEDHQGAEDCARAVAHHWVCCALGCWSRKEGQGDKPPHQDFAASDNFSSNKSACTTLSQT